MPEAVPQRHSPDYTIWCSLSAFCGFQIYVLIISLTGFRNWIEIILKSWKNLNKVWSNSGIYYSVKVLPATTFKVTLTEDNDMINPLTVLCWGLWIMNGNCCRRAKKVNDSSCLSPLVPEFSCWTTTAWGFKANQNQREGTPSAIPNDIRYVHGGFYRDLWTI